MKKRLDNVISQLQNLKLFEETPEIPPTNKKKKEILSGYVGKADFIESEKKFSKMLQAESEKIEENKRLIEEIISMMKYKISEREIKLLEEFLIGKIEEVKINFKKKFPLKIETDKTIKIIETQLKYIIDTYLRKNKSESWLVAKKPLNGFECASCEHYLGELSTKNQHICYKYPMRDPSDAAYRVTFSILIIYIFLRVGVDIPECFKF